jgi:carbamoyl-phosphate synthase small subunit
MSKQALLYLKNGQKFVAKGVGKTGIRYGECVFTTSMTGYTESLTDPSYAGQILCFASPLQGNYGVSSKWFESESIYAEGAVFGSLSDEGFHRDSEKSLEEFLDHNSKGAIVGIDTRKLVKNLRDDGNQPCVLIIDTKEKIEYYQNLIDNGVEFEEFAKLSSNSSDIGFVDWARRVNEVQADKFIRNGSIWLYTIESKINDLKVVVVDCGVKGNILKELSKRFGKVVVVKSDSLYEDIVNLNPDGILFSNGPGDPRDYSYTVDTMKKFVENYTIPVMGICLGHQILSLATGADVYKMVFGNRGANQPVQDLSTSKAYLTSQNHGYATETVSINESYKVFFQNLNDDTVEGIIHKTLPIFSVQFHPEASAGPQDTNWLFDKFSNSITNNQ